MTACAYFNLNSSSRMRSLKWWGRGASSEANNVSTSMVRLTKLQSLARRTLVKEVLYLLGNLVTKSRDSLTNCFDGDSFRKNLSGSWIVFQESREYSLGASQAQAIRKVSTSVVPGTIFFRPDHPTFPSWELSFALFIISYSRCT
jgi:hypothetical protein